MSDIECRYPKIIGFQLTDSVNIVRRFSYMSNISRLQFLLKLQKKILLLKLHL